MVLALTISTSLLASSVPGESKVAHNLASELTRNADIKLTNNAGGNLMVSAIGDRVWTDVNMNGIQDAGEPGLGGITINLYTCSDPNTVLASTVSAANGSYQFAGLAPGNYLVEFESLTGYERSAQDQGGNDEADSDAGASGFTSCITLTDNVILNSVDAGYYLCTPSGSLTCDDFVTIAIGTSCTDTVTYIDLLENEDGCSNFYDVELFFQGTPIGNIIDYNYINETLLGVVTNPVTGNFCEASITVLDNIDPTIVNCEDISILCTGSTNPAIIGQPVADDNCPIITSFLYTDLPGQDGGCDEPFVQTILRTWTATDQSGNTATCTQEIFFERPSIFDVVVPPHRDDKVEPALDCTNPDTSPENTGFPTVGGIEINSVDLCNIGYAYSDIQVPLCPGSYQLIRNWVIVDNCTQESRQETQNILVYDTRGPELTCPSNLTVSAGLNCEANANLPQVLFFDDCSGNQQISVVTETPVGTIIGNGGFLSGLVPGTYPITYIVSDGCENSSSCSINLVVADNQPPVAICDEETTIGLSSDGSASVCWPSFDDGSTDNCGIVSYKIKRADASLNTPFTDCVSFDCTDVGSVVGLRLRVYDIAGNYSEDDPNGRFNECTVAVTVQDNIKPTITCPADKTVGCWGFDPDIWDGVVQNPSAGPPVFLQPQNELIGYYGDGFDNCVGNGVVVEVSQTGGPGMCGEGVVTRVYTIRDNQNNTSSCSQVIQIINDESYVVTDTKCWATPTGSGHSLTDGIEWPCNLELNTCGAGLSPTDLEQNPNVNVNDIRPRIFEDACDLVGITFEDTEFPIAPSSCVKLLRKWTVIDWCQPDPSFALGYVSYSYVQEIVVVESQAPIIAEGTCEDITVCGYEEDCGPIPVSLTAGATDDCTPEEDLIYYYMVDLYSDGTNDVNSTNNPYAYAGNPKNVASGKYPEGTHQITWKVEDGCGNLSMCKSFFTLKDCRPPVIICKTLNVTLSPNSGEVLVNTSSFINELTGDNCTPEEEIAFSFSLNPNDNVRVFNCDDVGDVTVDIYATDEHGNTNNCETILTVSDLNNVCNSNTVTSSLGGMLVTEYDKPVANVDVHVSNTSASTPPFVQTTMLDGGYEFTLAKNQNYSVQPVKTMNPLNGVTTYDLVLMSQHVLGIEYLNSPYKVIAADVTNDGKITTYDIVELRKLILHINDVLPNNDSWKFVDKNYIFPNELDPFTPPFPEAINVNDLADDNLFADFVAVKIGDVDNSVSTSDFAEGDEREFQGQVTFQVDNAAVKTGDRIDLVFKAEQFEHVKGFQFTLSFDQAALEFQSIDALLPNMSTDNFGLSKLERGVITCSWNGEMAPGKLDVFSVSFIATQNGQISDLVGLNSSYTAAEAYISEPGTSGIARAEVLTQFKGGKEEVTVGGQFELYQNQPNPFSNSTVIGFYLPQRAEATLRVFEGSGRLLLQIGGDYDKGYNAIEIDGADLGEHGLIYYQLETAGFTDTKKMMFIR